MNQEKIYCISSEIIDEDLISKWKQVDKSTDNLNGILEQNVSCSPEKERRTKNNSVQKNKNVRRFNVSNKETSTFCNIPYYNGEICGRYVKNTKGALRKHKELYHSKLYECKCGERFSSVRYLMAHECVLKPQDTCPCCDGRFTSRDSLIKHFMSNINNFDIKTVSLKKL